MKVVLHCIGFYCRYIQAITPSLPQRLPIPLKTDALSDRKRPHSPEYAQRKRAFVGGRQTSPTRPSRVRPSSTKGGGLPFFWGAKKLSYSYLLMLLVLTLQ